LGYRGKTESNHCRHGSKHSYEQRRSM